MNVTRDKLYNVQFSKGALLFKQAMQSLLAFVYPIHLLLPIECYRTAVTNYW